MKTVLYKKSLFLVLLPVFFVWHGYIENTGLITAAECLLLLLSYLAAVGVLYTLFYLLYRDAAKAALISTMLMAVYFFFGAIHDFLKAHTTIWHKYSILLPMLFGIVLVTGVYLKRKKANLFRVNFFLNLLFLIYLTTDSVQFAWKMLRPDDNPYTIHGLIKNPAYKPCSNCPRPDIYFFIFDEYSSSASLAENLHYNNAGLDSFLIRKGFICQPHSFSNYNFTPFSVASILNMGYIRGIQDAHNITAEDYENAERLINANEVIGFLTGIGYKVVNYSIFDMATGPSPVEESLLPLKTRLITKQTLFARAIRDIGWNLGRFHIRLPGVHQNTLYTNLNNNNKLLQLVVNESRQTAGAPRFIYTHLEMPHWPFYYDANNKPRTEAELPSGYASPDIKNYTGYLNYTNTKLKELVDKIQTNTLGKACIIIMSDHGYRIQISDVPDSHIFKNLSAVYFPEKNYHLIKDSSSGVNQFRMIFNSLFNQQLPLLKDSTVFLRDTPRR